LRAHFIHQFQKARRMFHDPNDKAHAHAVKPIFRVRPDRDADQICRRADILSLALPGSVQAIAAQGRMARGARDHHSSVKWVCFPNLKALPSMTLKHDQNFC
jgi:hypothetical protein